MSANGSKADFISAFPPKTDIRRRDLHVRFVPKAVVSRRSKNPLSKASLFYHLAGNRRAVAVRDVITSVPPFARDVLADRAAIT
jgi:hypothetical protein